MQSPSPILTYSILIVDDSEDNRLILEELTKSLGYEPLLATNGIEAQAKVQQTRPSIILLDLNMPEMNGIEFLEWIKSDPNLNKIPILMVSTVDETEDIVHCLKLGAQDFIHKPFEVEILKSRILTALNRVISQKQEKELLEKTFVGSVKIFSDILTVLSPAIFGRSARIQRFAKLIAQELQYPNIWEIQLSALFSLIGTIALPSEILDKFSEGRVLSIDEQATFDSHPNIGAQLLSNIPRLEGIGTIIKNQNEAVAKNPNGIPTGSSILKAAIEFEAIHRKATNPVEFTTLLHSKEHLFDPILKQALVKVMLSEYSQAVKTLNVSQIKVGMLFASDVFTKADVKVFGQWQEISDAYLERLKMIHTRIGIKEPISIYLAGKS